MDKKGFTLVELIIVVTIIGILAMIAIPAYIGQQKRAARTEAYTNLENLRLLEEQYYAENGCYYRSGSNCVNYNPTTVTAIQAFLPGFKPGDSSSLNFDYSINITSSATNFTASAVGKTGTRVVGDTFTIDNNNNRNF